jgi:hypothetical protein
MELENWERTRRLTLKCRIYKAVISSRLLHWLGGIEKLTNAADNIFFYFLIMVCNAL